MEQFACDDNVIFANVVSPCVLYSALGVKTTHHLCRSLGAAKPTVCVCFDTDLSAAAAARLTLETTEQKSAADSSVKPNEFSHLAALRTLRPGGSE
jgi:hypothetical protein